MQNINIKLPTQCHLYRLGPDPSHQGQQLVGASKADMEVIKDYDAHSLIDTDESSRFLLKCKVCGQLYFYEFLEWINWKDGNDPQERNFIPVESEKDADQLNQLDPYQLTSIKPRISDSFSKDATSSVKKWVL